jgi:hypothetical protein
MYEYLKPGEEVTFQGLRDIKLIVVEVNETRANVRCKYFDDNLKKYIKLTLPADSLTPTRQNASKNRNISAIRRKTA